ncbi:MAG: tetratricopeptide repeat protein [Chloroflexota bacterium]
MLDRTIALIQSRRFDEAEKELSRLLADAPDFPRAHSLMALIQMERNANRSAVDHATQGIALAPDDPYPHYVHGTVLFHQDKIREAEQAVQEAIQLDPLDSNHFGLLARIKASRNDWTACLEAANQGLELDPEDDLCTNMRAMAQVKLGQREQSFHTLNEALHNDPENALTHANLGWTALETQQHQQAMEHFREALRLNPDLEWARLGILEALKARNFIYRTMLRYFFAMTRLNPGTQWLIILGGFFGFRIVRGVAASAPALNLILFPLMLLYIGFVYLSWTAKPLFNLLLRLDPFGKLVLSEEEVRVSNIVGWLLLIGVLAIAVGTQTDLPSGVLTAILCAVMVIPVAGTFNREGRSRLILGIYTIGLAIIALITVGLLVSGSENAFGYLGIFGTGIFIFSLLGNFLR